MSAPSGRRLVWAATGLPFALGAGLLVTRILPDEPRRYSLDQAREALALRLERQRVRAAGRPRDPVERLKLARCLIDLGHAKTLGHFSPGPSRGDQTAGEQALQAAAFANGPETAEASRLLGELTGLSYPIPVRVKAWRMLAVIAARTGDIESHRACRKEAEALSGRSEAGKDLNKEQ